MMGQDIINGIPNILLIGAAVTLIVIIVVIIIIKKNKGKKEEENVSILDVNNNGVPNSNEQKEFSYGYEKEPTVVMDPINEESINNIDTNIQNPIEEKKEENMDVKEEVDGSSVENNESLNAEIPTLKTDNKENIQNSTLEENNNLNQNVKSVANENITPLENSNAEESDFTETTNIELDNNEEKK